jgi:alpha-glucosidase
VKSFADSGGDGIGDLRGIIDHLDYLNDGSDASLGVDAVWLTPVFKSPHADFGYDVSDFYTVEPRFGEMADFDELLRQCHRRGIRVILDMVLNHTSREHPWFLQSRSSRDDPRRDWYIWRDGRSRGKPPNRWLAVVEGSAWEWDDRTRQYYYHAFLPFQPDLNWRNPEVRESLLDVCRFWLERGVDGFRLDLVNFLYEDRLLRDNPRRFGLRPYEWQKHIYDRSLPESVEAARELRRLTDAYSERMLVGEVYTDTRQDVVAFMGDGNDSLHLSFYLDFAACRWRAESFRAAVEWMEDNAPPAAWPCYYLSNHDLPRHYTRLGRGGDAAARARVAAAMMLTLRGTPFIYYGEELGMPAGKIPRKYMDDPIGKRFWPIPVGRDRSRTPMQWSADKHAGFSSAEPWLPVGDSYRRSNVEEQKRDPDSLLSWYRRLIRTRKGRRALLAGSYRTVEGTPSGVYAYLREAGEEKVAVFLNFTSRGRRVEHLPQPPAGRAWKVLLSTHGNKGYAAGAGGIILEADEVLLLEAAPEGGAG